MEAERKPMDNCSELQRIKKELPGYASWTIDELQRLFYQYRGIMVPIASKAEYEVVGYGLRTNSPDIDSRIRYMIKETNAGKQRESFERIVDEISADIDTLLRIIDCHDIDK